MNIKHLRNLLINNNINFNESVEKGHKTITVVSIGMDILDITEDGTARITAMKDQLCHFFGFTTGLAEFNFPSLKKYDDFQQVRLTDELLSKVMDNCHDNFNFDPGSLADIQEMRNTWAAVERLYLEKKLFSVSTANESKS